MSLLEQLRNSRNAWPSYMDNTVGQKLELLEKHKSEFPSKLRPIIDEAITNNFFWRDNPDGTYNAIMDNVNIFYVGRRGFGIPDVDLSNSLNSQVDSEQEVELVMRFFGPETDRLGLGSRPPFDQKMYKSPTILDTMSTHSQAQQFIPLYIKVWGVPDLGKALVPEAVLNLLKDSGNDLEDENSDAFVALKALLEAIEPNGYQLENVIMTVLWAGRKDASFMQSRIRFLIRWRPSILKCCNKHRQPLLTLINLVFNHHLHWQRSCYFDVCWALFVLIVKMGMEYFPMELGFISFHDRNYCSSCDMWGKERVSKLLSDEILTMLHKMESTQQASFPEMVVEAATANEDISLNGVYMLLRMNPAAITTRYHNKTPALEQKINEEISESNEGQMSSP